MLSKKLLLALTVPLTFSQAYARKQMIPKAEEIIQEATLGKYIFKNVQNERPDNWFNLSPKDGAEGVRSEEAYLIFGQPDVEDVIVAVIDSGVDVNHEDLQGKIWINDKEIPNNGIDDDGNGFIDDVFGWNFIGGANGMARIEVDASPNGMKLIKGDPSAQVTGDTLEITREVVRLKKLKRALESLGESLSEEQETFLAKISEEVEATFSTAKNIVTNYTARLNTYLAAEAVLKAAGLETITLPAVRALTSTDEVVLKAKKDMISLLSSNLTLARIQTVLEHYQGQMQFHYNENFDSRVIVGDDLSDQRQKTYGNNDVIGSDSHHGTHVAGIIAANRSNDLGMKGVATKVKIMAIRVVPNGDERDKDVANGIRYAVDNGAKIINMSFGKAYSPYKKVVDEAVRYAEEKGVLLVHAAGNDHKDNDLVPSFPSREEKLSGKEFSNWLEIGASSYLKGEGLPAEFSNYGKKTVDFFGPGVDIYSTTPDNSYDTYSGTSMATPAVAGVAALVLSFEENMAASDLRILLLDTSRRYPKLNVTIPGTESQAAFSALSRTGSIVDALEAIQAKR